MEQDFETTIAELCATCGGNIIRSNGVIADPGDIEPGPAVILTGLLVPEPTTALLIGLGVLGAAIATRRTR